MAVPTDERNLLPLVLAMLPRPWLRRTPAQTALDEARLQLHLRVIGDDVVPAVPVEHTLPNRL
jgi:hypothetical protein